MVHISGSFTVWVCLKTLHFLYSDASSWFKDPAGITAVLHLGPGFEKHTTSNHSGFAGMCLLLLP